MKKKSINNKGFSLIELIVAVLIMAIIGGGAAVALGSIFGHKTTASAKYVQDSLKQARVEALGLVNEESNYGADYDSDKGTKTNVYAKFYVKDSEIYADVCTNRSGSEVVLNSQHIGSTNYKLEFWKNGETSALTSIGDATDPVKVYFRKSTGGVASVAGAGIEGDASAVLDFIRVIGPASDHLDVIIVGLTGRSYVDNGA